MDNDAKHEHENEKTNFSTKHQTILSLKHKMRAVKTYMHELNVEIREQEQ